MILVDTSIWIDHLHASEQGLVTRLGDGEVGSHPAVIEELALGSINRRGQVLSLLADLWHFPTLTHPEVLELVERRRLWGRGLSSVDDQLLGAVALVPGARLWTRDKKLAAAGREMGVGSADG